MTRRHLFFVLVAGCSVMFGAFTYLLLFNSHGDIRTKSEDLKPDPVTGIIIPSSQVAKYFDSRGRLITGERIR